MNCVFFLGGDTAPSESHKSDDGSLTVGVARPLIAPGKDESFSPLPEDWRFAFVHNRVFNSKHKLSASQWSGVIYELDEAFGFEQVMLDAGSGGGGVLVAREMLKQEQIIRNTKKKVTVIGDKVNAPALVPYARFILNMFKRGDPGIETVWPDTNNAGKSLAGDELLKSAIYGETKTAFEKRHMEMIPPAEEFFAKDTTLFKKIEGWPEERKYAIKNLDAGGKQLRGIVAQQTPDGQDLFTTRGARVFRSTGKDDIALSHMMCYGAFLIWLKQFEGGGKMDEDDVIGFGGFPVSR